jgi:hypothetical protein
MLFVEAISLGKKLTLWKQASFVPSETAALAKKRSLAVTALIIGCFRSGTN